MAEPLALRKDLRLASKLAAKLAHWMVAIKVVRWVCRLVYSTAGLRADWKAAKKAGQLGDWMVAPWERKSAEMLTAEMKAELMVSRLVELMAKLLDDQTVAQKV